LKTTLTGPPSVATKSNSQQHLVEDEQRSGEHEDRQHRHQHQPEDIAVDGGEEGQRFAS
jgi:hypothetical protein